MVVEVVLARLDVWSAKDTLVTEAAMPPNLNVTELAYRRIIDAVLSHPRHW